jgi:hypothetical protein
MLQIQIVIIVLELFLNPHVLADPVKLWRMLTRLDQHFDAIDKQISEIKSMLSML